ncbi:MAG: Ig-like domain-containing protein [Gemmataceae bacterium]|nr:Ig-like domain-containing protein [Gemmata sp.]MDW8196554.1 Ig-like domain-containing protein [Gemmataceae bacterium]
MSKGRDAAARPFRFAPQMESLEDRTVPAGNVQVVVGDGILYVAGDDQDNRISITGAGTRTVVIRSLDGTTTINGQTEPLFVKGITRGYYIRMYGGDDVLIISGTRTNGQLDIGMGEGNNFVSVSDAGHRRETVIETASGDDTIVLDSSAFRRAVFINTGFGNDRVIANRVGVRDLMMHNPGGNDTFENIASTILRPNFIGQGFNVTLQPPAVPPPPGPVVSAAPVPTLTTTAPDPTRIAPLTFAVNFDKDVTGFDASGILLTNGTVSSFLQLDARTYTFQVLPLSQGVVTVSVQAGSAFDIFGNPNIASNTISRTFDSVAPSITINPLATNDTTPTITGTVNDPTATVEVTVNSQTLLATVTGTTWSATLTTPLIDGTYAVSASATDPAGNTASTTLSGGLVIDATPPTISFSASPAAITNSGTVIVTILFSENVTNFTAAAIAVGNGTKGDFQAIDGRTYTIEIFPQLDGHVTVSIPAAVALDAVGNPNEPDSFTIIYDTTPPTGTINPFGQTTITGTSDDGTVQVAGVENVVISIRDANGNYYTGPGDGFSTAAETFLPVATTDDFATWNFNLPIEGTYTVRAKITDRAGNENIIQQTVTLDTTLPTVVIEETSSTPGVIEGTASDDRSGVATVRVSVFNGTNYLSTSAQFDSAEEIFLDVLTNDDFATWTLAVPSGGPYTVHAIVTDNAGNVNSDMQFVTVL